MEPRQTLLPLEPPAAHAEPPQRPSPPEGGPAPAPAQREAFLRERLLAKARAGQAQSLGHRATPRAQGSWKAVSHGVRMKLLNESAHCRSLLLEMAAGTRFTNPLPAAELECLLLQGDLQMGPSRLAGAGDHLHAPAAPGGDEWTSRGGALFLLTCHLPRRT